jgi:Na+-driven multidrug efflux pump
VTCRRTAALTALIASLPLTAAGAVFLAQALLILALAQDQAAAPAGARWLFVIAVAICLGASLYLVGSGAYRALRFWGSLVRFATH